ncbi:MAG: hypothetical protein Q9162_001289 [Coniocarpon cinnabarinum]
MSKKSVTESETRLFAAVIKRIEVSAASGINWDDVAQETGYKDANNARVMFARFKKRMIEEGASTGDGVTKVKPSTKRGLPRGTRTGGGEKSKAADANVEKKRGRAKKETKSDKVVKEEEPDADELGSPANGTADTSNGAHGDSNGESQNDGDVV